MEDRLTSSILWGNANDYVLAAESIINHEKDRLGELPLQFMAPVCFLIGAGIELGLKAFLRGKGLSYKELKNVVGHNLLRAYICALKQKLKKHFQLERKYRETLFRLNNGYSIINDREFVYSTIGYKKYPHPKAAISLAKELLSKIHDECIKNMNFHDHKSTAVV
jgi:hypothetical protein